MTVRKIITLTIDKKLVFLVIAVSLIGIGLTVFLSFHYSKVILGERATYQLIGEAAIRGGTIERLLNTKMQEIQVITTNPMIRSVVSELNQIQDKKILIETVENKRTELLIEIQAFEVSIGGLDDLENVEIVGNQGQRLFSLVNNKSKKDFVVDSTYIHGKKEVFTQIILGNDGKRKIITAAPIFEKTDDTSVIGVAIITANTNQIDNVLLNRKGLGKTGESYLIDMSGNMISESRFIPNAAFKQNVNT
ncbi:MAG: cache domain-containing protein, partial [Candidatus Nitrosotenuis sp.]